MVARTVWKALLERRQRVALALAALTVASTLATTLLGLYSDIERKLRGQFYGYGANLVISPSAGQTIPLAMLAEVEKYGHAAPFLYSIQTVNNEPVVLAGVDFERLAPLTTYWRIDGRRHPETGECLVGERVAERFRLRPGSVFRLTGEGHRVAGIVSTGAAEDSQVLLPIEDVARRAGLSGATSLVTARVEGSKVEQARSALAAALPEADVRVLRAVVESEANVILKVRGTLFLLTVLILFITGLCVMNNFGAMVYQRRKEIGILKAIGGVERRIAALFAWEVAVMATVGSFAGFALGWALARWLGWQIFHQPASPGVGTLPAVVGITLLLALAATVWPLRQIRRIEPAVILRGE